MTTQMEQIEAKVQSLSEASGRSAKVEADLSGREEQLTIFEAQCEAARGQLTEGRDHC